ncbi:MAG TPA: protein kinase [Gemmatimonadaceae bacterium]|nr:protein kinase [Gemmatimonadaceae bacterium]
MTEPARGMETSAPGFWPAELDEHYENLGELGRGGMAVVFRARDRELGRHVAIKVVRPRFPADEEAVVRLAREARTVAQLEHPNIVALYAVRHLSDRSLALVMQLVPGRTLKATLTHEGRFEPARAEAVLRDVARALAYAHRAGVVHRDVKPENIFIDDVSGRAMLADFGVARAMDAPSELTATGTTIGTPTYMPPEQIDGAAVDGRADLYSLGMVGWEMLSGERPWTGESLYQVIYRQKHDPLPPIYTIRGDVSPRLQYLLDGLVQKNPDRRWSSATRFLTLLSSDEQPPGMQEWVTQQRRRMKFGAIERSKKKAAATLEAALETMRFARKGPGDGAAGTPETVAGETPQPPGHAAAPAAAAMAPGAAPTPPAPSQQDRPPFDWSAFERPPAVGGQQQFPEAEADPAVLTIPRQRLDRGRLIAGLAAVGVVVAGLWLWLRPGAAAPDSLAGGTPPLGDKGGIEIPVVPPARPAIASSDSAAAAVVDTPIIDTARAFLSRLAAEGERAAPREGAREPRQNLTPPPTPGSLAGAAAPRVGPGRTSGAPDPTVPRSTRTGPPPGAGVVTSPRSTTPAAAAGSIDTSTGAGRVVPSGVVEMPAVPLPAPVPPRISFPIERRTVSSGGQHSCLLRDDGRAECWGNNDGGQLGDGGFDGRTMAAPVAGDFRFAQIAAGTSHTCGITIDGGAFCWGSNRAGQLGDGTTSIRAAPVRVNSGETFAAVRAGQSHTCALARAGTVWCWGANADGQLGSSGRQSRSSPALVPLHERAEVLAVGSNHSCAITRTGSAFCWGRNDDGQLGDGSTADRTTPVPVRLDGPVVSIAAGAGHTCAVSTTGTAHCWGRNTYGQLGAGVDRSSQASPSPVSGGSQFMSVVAGSAHSCALGRDGSVWCWGRNSNGQVGDGTGDDRLRPVPVRGISQVLSLDAGAGHTCAMQVGGDTFCWGFNTDGQIGRGDRENALSPVRVFHPQR